MKTILLILLTLINLPISAAQLPNHEISQGIYDILPDHAINARTKPLIKYLEDTFYRVNGHYIYTVKNPMPNIDRTVYVRAHKYKVYGRRGRLNVAPKSRSIDRVIKRANDLPALHTLIILGETKMKGVSKARGVFQWNRELTAPNVTIIGEGRGAIIENSNPVVSSHNFKASNITFRRNKKNGLRILPSGGGSKTFQNCKFNNNKSGNGLAIRCGGLIQVVSCTANKNHLDGFNYHLKEDIEAIIVEDKCSTRGNGGKGIKNANGTTVHHHLQSIARINGHYSWRIHSKFSDKNRVCHDINNSTGISFGCKFGKSRVKKNGGSLVQTSGSVMYVKDCLFAGPVIYHSVGQVIKL